MRPRRQATVFTFCQSLYRGNYIQFRWNRKQGKGNKNSAEENQRKSQGKSLRRLKNHSHSFTKYEILQPVVLRLLRKYGFVFLVQSRNLFNLGNKNEIGTRLQLCNHSAKRSRVVWKNEYSRAWIGGEVRQEKGHASRVWTVQQLRSVPRFPKIRRLRRKIFHVGNVPKDVYGGQENGPIVEKSFLEFPTFFEEFGNRARRNGGLEQNSGRRGCAGRICRPPLLRYHGRSRSFTFWNYCGKNLDC